MNSLNKLWLLVLLPALSAYPVFGQTEVHRFSGNYDLATSDQFGNFYLTEKDQIIKIDSTGKQLYSFSDPESGNIDYIDASDPFRLLVYYKDYNQLAYLDKTLSPLGDKIGLDEINIFKPLGIAKSSRGGFWIIDGSSTSLIYINRKLNSELKINISGLDADNLDTWHPVLEWKDRLYICVPGKHILQFDLFGTQLRKIPSEARNISHNHKHLLLVSPSIAESLQSLPGHVPERLEINIPDWEKLYISGNYALVKQSSYWSLFRLKKTF